MRRSATEQNIEAVIAKIRDMGFEASVSHGTERVVVGLVGKCRQMDAAGQFRSLPGVEDVVPVTKRLFHTSRHYKKENSLIDIENIQVGGEEIVVMAGPCAVERSDQVFFTAMAVKEAGAKVIRGGAFKTQDTPEDFPGLGEQGLEILNEAKKETGLLVITEVKTPQEVELADKYADIIQIGARYMQSYDLLACVAERGKPIMLRRGIMSSVEELLLSAEYLMNRGNNRIMLCERGIRTFETLTPYTLDLCAVPILKRLSHLPVIVDPSHGTGDARYVPAMAKAAIACGADGLLIEVHPNPKLALSHGFQAIEPQQFIDLMEELRAIARAVGRRL